MCIDNNVFFGGLVRVMYALVVNIGLCCAWCIVFFVLLELAIVESVSTMVNIMCKILVV